MTLDKRLPILNIWVDPVSRDEALQRVRLYLENGTRPHSIFASNPEKNFSIPKDPVLYRSYKEADLLLPDGIGIVLAANKLYGTNLKRVPGSEFIFDICRLAEDDASVLGQRIKTLEAKIEQNEEKITWMNERLDVQQERLLLQFYHLETAIGKMQTSLNALASIQALPPLVTSGQ